MPTFESDPPFIKAFDAPTSKLLTSIWQDMEKHVYNESPFLTLPWLNYWLITSQKKPTLIVYYADATPCGLCFIGEICYSKLGVEFKTAVLNQSGNQKSDQAWIEYNDLVCSPGHKKNFFELLLTYLRDNGFVLFRLSMVSMGTKSHILHQKENISYSSQMKGYRTDFLDKNQPFGLSNLSKNTRSQIRRSNKKLLVKYGSISVKKPANRQEILQYFKRISEFHKAQWGSTNEGSGFNNSAFVELQKNLIINTDLAEILGVYAGEVPLGFCINYIHQGNVYFYCSGINHGISSNHIKPGYSMHAALMEHYSKLGFKKYDFMGGDAQYKESLSNNEYFFYSVSIPLATLKGKIIAAYYFFKKTFFK